MSRIEALKVNDKSRPVQDVIVSNCGQLVRKKDLHQASDDDGEADEESASSEEEGGDDEDASSHEEDEKYRKNDIKTINKMNLIKN